MVKLCKRSLRLFVRILFRARWTLMVINSDESVSKLSNSVRDGTLADIDSGKLLIRRRWKEQLWVDSISPLIFRIVDLRQTHFVSKAGVLREWREMKRSTRNYFRDQWNVLDALGILCLLVGMVIRWEDWTSPWGPAFYALSAPLVVSRVLFFAQILPFQGPMIQASSYIGVVAFIRSIEFSNRAVRRTPTATPCPSVRRREMYGWKMYKYRNIVRFSGFALYQNSPHTIAASPLHR